MNFKEGLAYAETHYIDRTDFVDDEYGENAVLGVAHLPDGGDNEFYIIELLFEPASTRRNTPANHDADGNVVDGYYAFTQFWSAADDVTTLNAYSCNSPDELAAVLPDYAMTLNYQVYNPEISIFDADFTEALGEIFQELPDDHFKAAAIVAINNLNHKA